MSNAVEVRRAKLEDIQILSSILALSFFNDPVLSWALRQDLKRMDALISMFTLEINDCLKRGEVLTTTDLQACAIWYPPEHPKSTHILRTIALLPVYIRWTQFKKVGRWVRLLNAFEKNCPKNPHYYLDWIGVHPDKQGKGYASALLYHKLNCIDRERTPAYLESSNIRNIALYKRYGFKVTTTVSIPNGPNFWPMWRDVINK